MRGLSQLSSMRSQLVKAPRRLTTQSALCVFLLFALGRAALAGPSISANEEAISLEIGSTLSVYETVYNAVGTVTFQWYKSTESAPTPTAIPGAVYQTLTIVSVGPLDAGTYSVTATDLSGPTSAAVAIVTIDPPVAPIFVIQPQPVTAVEGQSATFSVTTTGSLPQTFQWYIGTQPIAGATGTTLTLNAARTSDAGAYSVVATNATGSTPSSPALLSVSHAVAPAFTTSPRQARR